MTVTAVKPDFGGYATKANLKCTDGRTIMPDAFKHMDGMKVPLVWQHLHSTQDTVLGHALLEARPDGVYCQGFFNDTTAGATAKALVAHGDIEALSIYANKLVERAKQVFHGVIREVSLVLSGANPGAKIDYISIQHRDGEVETREDEAIIYTGLKFELSHSDEDVEEVEHDSLKEIYDAMSDEEKSVVAYMVGVALEGASAEHSDKSEDDKSDDDPEGDDTDGDKPGDSADNDEGDLNHKEGSPDMTRNLFEQKDGKPDAGGETQTLSHDAMREVVQRADSLGSLKAAFEEYGLKHGIENIEVLFPEAKNLTNTPEWNKRRTEWVAGVLSGVAKTPFSRIRSVVADITMDEARALGYIKGNLKKEEWFSLTARTTTPTTVYKKQKLDRDDIIDITDFDVVAWMKVEMRIMLEEEIARAILIGDGRPVEDPNNPGAPNPDKILDPAGTSSGPGIRSILNEHELYATTVNVILEDTSASYASLIKSVLRARKFYRGTGTPTFYTTNAVLTELLLIEDTLGRRIYADQNALTSALRVDSIVEVEVMEPMTDLVGIMVNLRDYNVGTDRGGEVNFFDDFDIDYNQYKYLGETRMSGALTRIKSALIIRKVDSGDDLVAPEAPTFNNVTGVITIPTVTGVTYKADSAAGATLSAGAQTALAPGATKTVVAVPNSGFYFATSENDEWNFKRVNA